MGLSIAAIAHQTEEQTKFLNEKSIRIAKIVEGAKKKFTDLKDKRNKVQLEKHIQGFSQTIDEITKEIIKPLEQFQTRSPKATTGNTFGQAALLFKEILEQLVEYLHKINTAIVTANNKPYSKQKAKKIAESIKNSIDQIKKSGQIKNNLVKIEELQKLLREMGLPEFANQVQHIHDLCQQLLNEQTMKPNEQLAIVTAIDRKLKK